MKKLCAAVLVVLTSSGLAWAGKKSVNPVQVNLAGRFASGSLGSTRNSADTTSYITCEAYASAGGAASADCLARDAVGGYIACYTSDPVIVDLIKHIQGDAWIWFSWDVNNRCNYISVNNASTAEPKR